MLGNLFEPCRPAVREHKVRLSNPQFLLFLLRFHNCMDLRTYRCKNRSARCLITCRRSLQSGARQAARPTSAPRRLRPLRRRSRRRSLTGSTDSGSWPARPSAVQSNFQRLFRRRASHRPAVEQVRLPGYLYETGAPREKGLRSYHERYHKRDDAKLAILAKESPAVSFFAIQQVPTCSGQERRLRLPS